MPNDFQAVVDALEPWRKRHTRYAYRPLTQAATSLDGVSRFGGAPLLGPTDNWPSCGRCARQLNLLLQLDLAALPTSEAPFNSGVLQVFYCTQTDFDTGQFCDDFEAFSPCHHLRVIANSQLSPHAEAIPDHIFPAADIVGWEKFADHPSGVEHDRLGLRYDYDFKPGVTKTDVQWEEGSVQFTGLMCTNDADGDLASAIASAAPKDKLLGWPMWVQGVEYPACPQCKREMKYFFQLDSEDNVPHMFGDVGCGHISYCPDHPDMLAFTWACS